MNATRTTETTALHLVWNAVLFSIAGPPIGALSVLAVIFAIHPSASQIDLTMIPVLSIIGMSYVLGLVPAAITGTLVFWRGRVCTVSCQFVLLSATLAIVGPIVAYALIGSMYGSVFSQLVHLLLFGSLAVGAYPAALICFMIARKAGCLLNERQ